MITVTGARGKVNFNDYGKAIDEGGDYPDIVQLDLVEWCLRYPKEDPREQKICIFDIGY